MGSKWVYVLMFVSLAWCLSQGCLDEERVALLQLKHFFNGSSRYNDLSDWIDGEKNSNCCQWSHLECSNNTGRVTRLYLMGTRNENSGEWYLNVSLFSVFEELECLYLSANHIAGFVENEGLSRLSNLELLNLQYNMFNDDILSSLHVLSSLKVLFLDDNKLKGTTDFPSLNNLERLDLSGNNLGNSILSSVGALSSLKELYLDDIGLKGIIDISGLHSLNNLEVLRMGFNKIDKFIFLKDNTSPRKLSCLYLGNNNIHDMNNLLQFLGSFPSLEAIDLSYNNFNETTTIGDLVHLKNTKNLKELYMDNTNLNITFLQIIGLLTSPSLEILTLSNFGLQGTLSHQGGGILVEFLYNQHNLSVVDLSSNNLTGEFPNWLLEDNKKLFALNLANNSLGGCFQPPTHSHLFILDISKNFFHGHIPKEIGEYLPSLRELYLSHNHFDGSIPSSIGDMNSLEVLDLSYNQMSSKIPEHLVEGCSWLRLLLLANNSFQGQMFASNFNLINLERLQLDGNNFTGKIPDSLSNASYLKGLYLSDNNLSGRLPSWLGNMSLLEDIIMPNNHLEGPIPSELFQLEYLTILNLAGNNLSGSLPYGFKSPFIQLIHLSKNSFQGQLSDFLVNSSFIVTLDLGYNQLHGSIPTWINLNFNLKHLILRNNNLSGELPTQLCQLNQLRLIGFSHNNLSGHIPPCLEFTALHDNRNSDVEVDSTHIMGSASNGGKIVQIRNEEIVEFTTKTSSYLYEGKVLTYLSGIDLSCNKLTGLIPQQVGNLTKIHTLNLSHNNLTGPIPLTFSKLKQIESLDLSYNNLNGKIPFQLVELNFLTSFSVAHNNLSGKTPERIAQFGTFEENCYVGNPLLCGPPLNKSCDIIGPQPPMPRAPADNGKDNDFIDLEIFYMSFMGSYIIVLIGIGAVLYINPYWRRTWFYLLETWMISFYYFIVDNLPG